MSYDTSRLAACGDDVRIDDAVVIRYPRRVRIGSHVAIDGFVHVSTGLELGDYIHVGPLVSIVGGRHARLMMSDFCGIAAGCRIICAGDDLLGSGMTNPMIPRPCHAKVTVTTVLMEKHSVLGTNCVVFPGVRIGEGAVAAACSVIKNDMEPWTVYAGNPAVPKAPRPRKRILALEAQLRADLKTDQLLLETRK